MLHESCSILFNLGQNVFTCIYKIVFSRLECVFTNYLLLIVTTLLTINDNNDNNNNNNNTRRNWMLNSDDFGGGASKRLPVRK